MPAREDSFIQAIGVIGAGSSLDIIGDHGSGRSRMLSRICEHFLARDWSVLHVKGGPTFRNTAMSALAWLGVNTTTLATAYAGVTDLVRPGRSLIAVDNWDDVDDISWGVLTRVREDTGVPIILVRVRGNDRRATASEGFMNTFQVTLAPMSYEALRRAVEEHTGQQLSTPLMAELFAKAGGNIGVAIALYESAVRAGRIRVDSGMATLTGELWNPGMSTISQSLLRGLDQEQRSALETLSAYGPVSLRTAADAVGDEVLEGLGDRGLVDVYTSAVDSVVHVHTPVISEYFRHQPQSVRHALRAASAAPDSAAFSTPGVETEAQFATLIQEHQRRSLMLAREAWATAPSKTSATDLLKAMVLAGESDEDIAELVAASQSIGGSDAGKLEWDEWYLGYLAHNDRSAEEARGHIEARVEEDPVVEPWLRAWEAGLDLLSGRPASIDSLPDESELEDPQARFAVLRAKAFFHIVAGNTALGLDYANAARALRDDELFLNMLTIVAFAAETRYECAAAVAATGRAEAMARFDRDALYGYSYGAALVALVTGRTGDLEELLRSVRVLGAPSSGNLSFVGLLAVASSGGLAVAGGTSLSTRLDAEGFFGGIGPYPVMQPQWVEAGRLSSEGKHAEASDVLTEMADTLWNRGLLLAAAYAYCSAAETDLGPRHLPALRDRVLSLQALAPQATGRLLIARITKDKEQMVHGARQSEERGRPMLAQRVWGEVADLARESDDADLLATADAAQTRLNGLGVGGGGTEGRTGQGLPPTLTTREREVAQLAASGLQNPEIAKMLHVSARTVETHLYRAMNKAGVDSRKELRERFR